MCLERSCPKIVTKTVVTREDLFDYNARFTGGYRLVKSAPIGDYDGATSAVITRRLITAHKARRSTTPTRYKERAFGERKVISRACDKLGEA